MALLTTLCLSLIFVNPARTTDTIKSRVVWPGERRRNRTLTLYFFQVTACLLIFYNVHFQEINIPNPRKIIENAKREVRENLKVKVTTRKYKLEFPQGWRVKTKIPVKEGVWIIQFSARSRIFKPGPGTYKTEWIPKASGVPRMSWAHFPRTQTASSWGVQHNIHPSLKWTFSEI